MNTTIGTAQQALTRNSSNATDVLCFITKFVSEALNQTSVAANTWTYNFSFKIANDTNQTAPVISTGNLEFNPLPVTCYVWRPSSGAKVGNIFDANTAGTTNEFFDCSQGAANGTQQFAENGTFTGSLVTCQVGDVIIIEAWCYSSDNTARASALNYYYDGTTANTTSEAVVSNHASFLQTPENLSFVTVGGPIDMTESASKTYANKFITKV